MDMEVASKILLGSQFRLAGETEHSFCLDYNSVVSAFNFSNVCYSMESD
jgi:hypothetical protein